VGADCARLLGAQGCRVRRESQSKFSLCCEGVECAPSLPCRAFPRALYSLQSPTARPLLTRRALLRARARRVLLNESHHDITVDVPIDMDAKPEVIKETAETLRRVEKVAHDALHSH
jgi:hypothetical protein